MLSIHSYELVHQEPVPGTNDEGQPEILALFYDQIKGGCFYVLLPKVWFVQDILPFLEHRRIKQGLFR